MWDIFKNIFGTISSKEVLDKIDDWGLTKEEVIQYQLEWIKIMPSGFQIAQRFIGIAFSVVFLFMVVVAFVMLCFGLQIDHLIEYISITMVNPIMIIFSLFFGGGLVNSFKGMRSKRDPISPPRIGVDNSKKAGIDLDVEQLSNRQKRTLERWKEKMDKR